METTRRRQEEEEDEDEEDEKKRYRLRLQAVRQEGFTFLLPTPNYAAAGGTTKKAPPSR